MKKNILNISAIVLIATASVLTGCKKDDITAPVVTLTGAASQTISLQGTYTELGATAEDEKDGKLTPSVSGAVDKNLVGVYTITYTSTDAAGNSGTATRTVTVVNDAAIYEGDYTVSEALVGGGGASTYPQTITASKTENNKITFSKFANYVNNTGIYGTIVGTTLTIPSQTTGLVGSPAASRNFSGSATGLTASGFALAYTEVTNGTTASYIANFSK